MIPINMRTSLAGSDTTANFSAYVLCKLGEDDDLSRVHRSVKQVLASGFHWSCWRVLNIGRIGGKT